MTNYEMVSLYYDIVYPIKGPSEMLVSRLNDTTCSAPYANCGNFKKRGPSSK